MLNENPDKEEEPQRSYSNKGILIISNSIKPSESLPSLQSSRASPFLHPALNIAQLGYFPTNRSAMLKDTFKSSPAHMKMGMFNNLIRQLMTA